MAVTERHRKAGYESRKEPSTMTAIDLPIIALVLPIVALVVVLLLFDLAAAAWGVDSRPGLGDDTRR